LVLQVLLDLLVARRLQELAILDLGQDLAPGRGLLASLLAGVGDLPGGQLDGADRVVVARDDVGDQVRVAVAVRDRDHGDLQPVRLGDGDVLLARVDDVQGAGEPLHVRDAVEVKHQPVELVLEALGLLLRHLLELAFLLHLAQVLQALDSLLDGAEVGQHAAHPAAVDEVHALARRLGLDRLLGLLLGPDEEHRTAARRDVADEVPRVVEQAHGLLQVDDVNAVARGEDIRLHLWIPAAGLVSEMDAGLQQLLQGHFSHVGFACLLFKLPPGSGLGIEDRGIAPGVLTQSDWDWLVDSTHYRSPGKLPAHTPAWPRAVTVVFTWTLPGVSAGNRITASGDSRWSSSIHAQAEWPCTVAYGPGPSCTSLVAGGARPVVAKKMLWPFGESPVSRPLNCVPGPVTPSTLLVQSYSVVVPLESAHPTPAG